MGDSIQQVARSWLVDPAWQKVFKHTTDVIEDYICYLLIALGTVALSVRLLTTLASGDLVCIIVGITNGTAASLDPYPPGGTIGMVNYAQSDEICIRKVLTPFMEYLPYIMLLQTLLLVIIEKFTFKIPRIAQKVERFYLNIVEESLFGTDPDVAEDMTDPKTSTEAISRRRQRNEICTSLKRSSIIHHVYIGKNLLEVFIVMVFLPLNFSFAVLETEPSTTCKLPIQAFPGLVDEPGEMQFQCRGKKQSFFQLALWVQIALLFIHLVLSLGGLIWCWRFRSVTNLLRTIESLKSEWDDSGPTTQSDGFDFLFLFDLLAHSCGIESTLRVLSHSDDTFYEICKPNIDINSHVKLEEDKLKIGWEPADIERWLHSTGAKEKNRGRRAIDIDSYEVTIFPAESVKNSQTLPAKWSAELAQKPKESDEPTYSTWFFDLLGGRTEYVLTIACTIGKSRMKGEKVVTPLVPYGPEKPRNGMMKTAWTNQLEIFWDPPKGEFTKYSLWIDLIPNVIPESKSSDMNLLRLISYSSMRPNSQDESEAIQPGSGFRKLESLSYKLTQYTILGLEPAESYGIRLETKTGNVVTRQPIWDTILTKPQPVLRVMVSDVQTNSAVIQWLQPEAHSRLRAFQLRIFNTESGQPFKDLAVPKTTQTLKVPGLAQATDYTVSIVCLAVHGQLRQESKAEEAHFATSIEPLRELKVDNVTTSSVVVKWERPANLVSGVRSKLTIKATPLLPSSSDDVSDAFDYENSVDLAPDRNQYNFSKLPDPDSSAREFVISHAFHWVTPKENAVTSTLISARFMTLPHRPTGFKVGSEPFQIEWIASASAARISRYRVAWRDTDDKSSAHDASVDPGQTSFTFRDLLQNVVYNVNIFALVDLADDQSVKSKELHEKVIMREYGKLEVYKEVQHKDAAE